MQHVQSNPFFEHAKKFERHEMAPQLAPLILDNIKTISKNALRMGWEHCPLSLDLQTLRFIPQGVISKDVDADGIQIGAKLQNQKTHFGKVVQGLPRNF